ncbi:MAG: energy transducer TonB [Chitinophagales bacterium]|nr:energy transducer TonB [Chitinophagales bacterium]
MKNLILILLFLAFTQLQAQMFPPPPPYIEGKQNNYPIEVQIDTSNSSEIYLRAEIQPSFPGGENALMQYLEKYLVYPEKAVNYNIQGKVYLKFYIDTDGSVRDAKVVKDGTKGSGCAEEALRVINNMPKWSPGIQRGKPVKVYYTLPITFTLSSDKQTQNAVLIDSSLNELGEYLFVYPKSNKINYYAEMRYYISSQGNTDFVDVLQTNIDDEYLKTQLELQAMRAKWIPAKYGISNASSSEVKTSTFNTVVYTKDSKVVGLKYLKDIIDNFVKEKLTLEEIKTKLLKKHVIDIDEEIIESISKIKTY